jgi:acyl carrier protein
VAEQGISRESVLELLRERFAVELGLEPEEVTAESRFDEDLHADSLDLVAVTESVERRLVGQGLEIALPDEALAETRTVGEAADVIAAHTADG